MAPEIAAACARSAAAHERLCPRQVLGVRIGLALTAALGLACPDPERRLVVIVETDGCFVDGVSAATDCTVGHRTLRVAPYGRVAAVGIDRASGRAVRAAPRPDARRAARAWARPGVYPGLLDPGRLDDRGARWAAQLVGYQRMPEAALLTVTPVAVRAAARPAPTRDARGPRTTCDGCGEEVLDGRARRRATHSLCPACIGPAYYTSLPGPA